MLIGSSRQKVTIPYLRAKHYTQTFHYVSEELCSIKRWLWRKNIFRMKRPQADIFKFLKVWNNDVSMKLLRSNQNGKDQSGANQPSVDWGGGVTGGQKDEWAWLVGWEPPGLSMLGEKPGHSAERESRKEGQEMRTRSNPERQNCVKKIYPPPALLQERNPHPSSCSGGQVRQGYVAVCPFSSDMPPAFTTQHFKAAHLGTVRDGVGIMLAQQAKSHAPSLQQRSWSDLWPLGLPHILLPFPFFHLTVSCLFNLYSPSAPCNDCTINFMDMY